jgi:hypothetical protein
VSRRRPTRTPRDPRFADYPDTFLVCRSDRHDLPSILTPDEVIRWRYPDADVLERRRRCRRCGSVQVMKTNEADGSIYQPTRFEYEDGYTVIATEEEPGPVPRSRARLEQVRRFLDNNPIPQQRHA